MPHATATFNGKVIAEADKWEYVEGNIYVECHPFSVNPMLMTVVSAQLCGPVGPQQGYADYALPLEG